MPRKLSLLRRALLLAAATGLAPHAAALTYTEIGDAGDLPTSAALVTLAGVTQIAGSIGSAADIDLYRVLLTAGTPFTAQTNTSGFFAGGIEDTRLFLFDAAGFGVRYNDDRAATDFLSAFSYTPAASGVHYLAVAPLGWLPSDASLSFLYVNDFDTTLEQGASAFGALAQWSEDGSGLTDAGDYTVDLSGVAPVPEADTWALLLCGLGVVGFVARRRGMLVNGGGR